MQTIRDLIGREQLRAAAMPPAPKQKGMPGQMPGQPMPQQPGTPGDGSATTLEELQEQFEQQQAQAGMLPGQSSIKPSGALPMHEVNANPTKYPMEQAQAYHSFLKHAAGGPATGFVTTNPESHKIAKDLAKSGHLTHNGSQLGGAGGGTKHHWSITPKGLTAIGQGPTKKVAGAPGGGGQMGRPGMNRPGMPMMRKPGMAR